MAKIFEELTDKQQFYNIKERIKDLTIDIIEFNKLNSEKNQLNAKEKRERKIKADFILLKFSRIWELISISKLTNETKLELFKTLSEKIKSDEKGKTR